MTGELPRILVERGRLKLTSYILHASRRIFRLFLKGLLAYTSGRQRQRFREGRSMAGSRLIRSQRSKGNSFVEKCVGVTRIAVEDCIEAGECFCIPS